jgi:hypothetical protein
MTPKHSMSPVFVETLLFFHYSAAPHPRMRCTAVSEATNYLFRIGAIEETVGLAEYRTTEMGRAWVKSICSVPPPKQAWLDEAGNIL